MARGDIIVRVLGDTRDLERKFGAAATSVDGFGDKMARVGQRSADLGRKLSIGVTLPLLALGKTAFDAASDLEESTSKVGVVFGQAADKVKAFADDSAKSMGIARQQALEAAGTFGNLFVAMKIGEGDAAKMSTRMVQLASDLASFNNASPEEALDALRSGLVGETEPLKRFGVNLNEARLKAKALELGLGDGKATLDAAAKAQAAYALILEDTKTAQGDFARTADGAANKQRILAASFKDAAAEIGTKLLPVGQRLLDFVGGLLEKFNNLSPGTQDLILKLAGVAAAVGPVLFVGGKLVTMFATVGKAFSALSALMAINPWVLLIAATVALVILIVKNWDKIVAALKVAWEVIKAAAGALADKLKAIWGGIRDAALKVFGFLKSLFLNFTPVGRIIQHWRQIKDFFVGAWNAIRNGVREAFDFVASKIRGVINTVTGPVRGFINLVKKLPFVPGSPIPMVEGLKKSAAELERTARVMGRVRGSFVGFDGAQAPTRFPSALSATRQPTPVNQSRHVELHVHTTGSAGSDLNMAYRMIRTLEGR